MRHLWIIDLGLRRRRRGLVPGWRPLLDSFLILYATVAIGAFVGLSLDVAFWLAGFVDVYLSQRLIRSHWRRVARLEWRGPARARWWIESAALALTLAYASSLFWFIHEFAGQPPAWANGCLDTLGKASAWLAGLYSGLALAGFLLGIVQGKPVNGRSSDLVSCCFWLPAVAALALVVPFPRAIEHDAVLVAAVCVLTLMLAVPMIAII